MSNEKETIEIAKRWLAFAASCEFNNRSNRWSSRCISFEFTSRKANAGDLEIDPSVAYNADAISEAEAGNGRLGPLFWYQRAYAIVLGMME